MTISQLLNQYAFSADEGHLLYLVRKALSINSETGRTMQLLFTLAGERKILSSRGVRHQLYHNFMG